VLGEFLGDQELLVLAPSETGRRRILIALPLDSRADWLGAAQDLGEFLERYFDHASAKYWERPDGGPSPKNVDGEVKDVLPKASASCGPV
jgi:hypothetical protein